MAKKQFHLFPYTIILYNIYDLQVLFYLYFLRHLVKTKDGKGSTDMSARAIHFSFDTKTNYYVNVKCVFDDDCRNIIL